MQTFINVGDKVGIILEENGKYVFRKDEISTLITTDKGTILKPFGANYTYTDEEIRTNTSIIAYLLQEGFFPVGMPAKVGGKILESSFKSMVARANKEQLKEIKLLKWW